MSYASRGYAAAVAAVIAVSVPAAAGAAEPALSTPDGAKYAFSTQDALVPADTDSAFDVYTWDGSSHELISEGTGASAVARAISRDGERVVFMTAESLLPGDADSTDDVYESVGGEIRLVSTGPGDVAGGGGWAYVADVSDDGERIAFQTSESLVSQDTDSDDDIYVRSGGTTTLVSTSPLGDPPGDHDHDFVGASRDGTRIFEATEEPLVGADQDPAYDYYERSAGTTKLVSTGTLDIGGSAVVHDAGGPSADGSSFVFLTTARMERGDTNSTNDLYQRRNGRTRLLTANGLGLAPPCPEEPAPGPGPLPCTIWDSAQTADGSTVAFPASQQLVSSDTNNAHDVYRRSGSAIERVAPGHEVYMTEDGSRLVFVSNDRLTAGDTDSHNDIYARQGGVTTLLTPGTPADHATFEGASRDLTRVFFTTKDGALPGDADGQRDIYRSSAGSVEMVSTGPNDDHVADPWGHHWDATLSEDGTAAFFASREQLVPEDTDSSEDIYRWVDGETRLVTG